MVKLGVMGNRGDLTNEQWERIEPLLPKVKTKRGRPAQDHRKLLNGVVWVLRTGAPWRRHAGTVWEVDHDLQPFPALA